VDCDGKLRSCRACAGGRRDDWSYSAAAGQGSRNGSFLWGGSSQTVFGAAGSAGFLTKLTAGLAAVFFVTSLGLAIYARKSVQGDTVLSAAPVIQEEQGDVPAIPEQPTVQPNDLPVAPAK